MSSATPTSLRQHDLDAAHVRGVAVLRRQFLGRDPHRPQGGNGNETASHDLVDVDRTGNRTAARLHDDLARAAVEVGHDREDVVHRRLLPDVDNAGIDHGRARTRGETPFRKPVLMPYVPNGKEYPVREERENVLGPNPHEAGGVRWRKIATRGSTPRRASSATSIRRTKKPSRCPRGSSSSCASASRRSSFTSRTRGPSPERRVKLLMGHGRLGKRRP